MQRRLLHSRSSSPLPLPGLMSRLATDPEPKYDWVANECVVSCTFYARHVWERPCRSAPVCAHKRRGHGAETSSLHADRPLCRWGHMQVPCLR